jgi:hypothetical protein
LPKYDLSAINSVRKPYCELCGSPTTIWPHHIKPRGAGGKDVKENLIQLCFNCHRDVHDGKLHRRNLVEIVAKREGLPVKEIYKLNGWLLEDTLPGEIKTPNPIAGDTFEEIIELYISCLEKGENSMWDKAALITVMHDHMKMAPRQIASAIGCSASLCRKMVRVFKAFPSEAQRIPMLSFRHHQIASYTSDPQKWIAEAADNQWSTRVLQDKINSTKDSDVEKKDKAKARAEKVLLLVSEILDEHDSISLWLEEELQKLVNKKLIA